MSVWYHTNLFMSMIFDSTDHSNNKECAFKKRRDDDVWKAGMCNDGEKHYLCQYLGESQVIVLMHIKFDIVDLIRNSTKTSNFIKIKDEFTNSRKHAILYSLNTFSCISYFTLMTQTICKKQN